jgi:hypothetical protein
MEKLERLRDLCHFAWSATLFEAQERLCTYPKSSYSTNGHDQSRHDFAHEDDAVDVWRELNR